jgi:CheY-like chemotaxis protein
MENNGVEQKSGGEDEQNRPRTVLLVDDKHDSRITLKWFLDTFGYVVQTARSAHEALTVFDPSLHDLVLTDNSMPGMTGAEMAHIIKMRSPATPVLMYTGEPPADRSCLDVVIQKPAHLMELKSALDQLLSTRPQPEPPHPDSLSS